MPIFAGGKLKCVFQSDSNLKNGDYLTVVACNS
jgi:hypothetical protein